MTEVTFEEIEKNISSLIESIPQDNLVPWKQIKASQSELDKGFEATAKGNGELKNLINKNFLNLLKELKSYEAKDLLKQFKDKKIESSQLTTILPFIEKKEGDVLAINKDKLVATIKEQNEKFEAINQQLTQKFFEIAKWLSDQINEQKATLPKEVPKTQVAVEEQKGDNQQSEGGVSNDPSTGGEGGVALFDEKNQQKINFSETKLSDIVSQIKIVRIPDTPGLISIQTYAQIVEKCVDLAEEEFIRITTENRNDRRSVMHSETEKYRKLIMEHMNDIENLLMKSQEDICSKLGISQDTLEQSEMMLMERGLGQHIFMMQAGARQQIKEKLPQNKQVSLKITQDIIQFQIKVLNNRQDYFQPVLSELPNTYEFGQLIPIILNIMINDLVYQEHSYEEEDYMQNLTDQDAWKDNEVVELMKGIEKGIFSLLSNLGYIPQGGPMMPPMGQGGMPGGMGFPPNMFY